MRAPSVRPFSYSLSDVAVLGTVQGAVDIFVKHYLDPLNSTFLWVYSTSLFAEDGKSLDRLGLTLALHGFTVVAGAPTRSLTINPKANVVRSNSCWRALLHVGGTIWNDSTLLLLLLPCARVTIARRDNCRERCTFGRTATCPPRR